MSRRNKPANKHGCKPTEDVCVAHDMPLDCPHGCYKATAHKCAFKEQPGWTSAAPQRGIDLEAEAKDYQRDKAKESGKAYMPVGDAYTVDQEESGCKHCYAGRMYRIVGPDGVGLGFAMEDADEIAVYCDNLNDAFKQGLAARSATGDMVLVPRQPTTEMLDAAVKVYDYWVGNGYHREIGVAMYHAFLNALDSRGAGT